MVGATRCGLLGAQDERPRASGAAVAQVRRAMHPGRRPQPSLFRSGAKCSVAPSRRSAARLIDRGKTRIKSIKGAVCLIALSTTKAFFDHKSQALVAGPFSSQSRCAWWWAAVYTLSAPVALCGRRLRGLCDSERQRARRRRAARGGGGGTHGYVALHAGAARRRLPER